MMMMGIKFMGDVPFRDVYIHALVRDEHGKKMSKSLGNVIDPLVVMDKYGTDAFRFTLAALAAQGRDIRLSENRIEGYRNFMNKLWNAARFTLPYCEKSDSKLNLSDVSNFSLPERWILSRLNRTIDNVCKALQNYSFNDAAQSLYEFSWHEFCDWCLEISKIQLADDDPAVSSRAAAVLNYTLDSLLRLLHPFVPFITEEIFSKLNSGSAPILRCQYPSLNNSLIDEGAEKDMNFLMSVISAVRNLRAEMNVAPGKILPVNLACESDAQVELVRTNMKMVTNLAKISNLDLCQLTSVFSPPQDSVTAVVSGARIYISLRGLVDPSVEITRLEKELAKISGDYELVEKKLANQSFISKAKPEAIQKQRDRRQELATKLEGLRDALNKMLSIQSG
jgi:valyl-tRNA synthetase